MIYAEVAVNVPARAGALFTYAVPPEIVLRTGNIVVVPFSSRILPGIVVSIGSQHPELPTRQVLGLVQGAPWVSTGRVRVALWMAEHYRNPLFPCLSLFLPPGWQRAIAEERGGLGSGSRWVFKWLPPFVSEETVLALPTRLGASKEPKAGSVRARVLALLEARHNESAGVLAADARAGMVTLRAMVKQGELEVLSPQFSVRGGESPVVMRESESGRSLTGRAGAHLPSPGDRRDARVPLTRHLSQNSGLMSQDLRIDRIVLDEAQTAAFAPIAVTLESRSHRTFLLHGVTGSGKTHVYFRLIEAAVRSGRKAIVLVSEIAQTPEALERYAQRFPGRVALLHSELPAARRWELWRGICEGHFDVVVGPRSVLFSPLPDLGLIVMDEEHEPAYKQNDLPPRYHAREAAIRLGAEASIPVVLGSATPDIASYYLAEKGEYTLLSLPNRYSGPTDRGLSSGRLPKVEVVDLRWELRSGNNSILSRKLQRGLEQALERQEQVILFLNRRGASTAVVCRDCGHVVKCGRCDVALVYHKEMGGLLCHQCNRQTTLVEKCPRCKSRRISYFGAGTERVEEEVRKLYPAARVLRWDHDVAASLGGHTRIHDQFRRHEADVLVGTQMVAKALDFPLVTLVGVVLADVTLHLPDFRAAERTFQLLSQVAGRAGRGEEEGKVIIQTYAADHYAVLAAAEHDYLGFYQQELEFRRHHSYPPFRRLIRLLFTTTGEIRARYEALLMKKVLDERIAQLGVPDVDVLGPAPAFHSRIRSRWRWQILLAGEGATRLLRELELPRGWTVDIDPVSLL